MGDQQGFGQGFGAGAGGMEVAQVFEGVGDASGVGGESFGEAAHGGGGEEAGEAQAGDVVFPDGEAFGGVERLEADGVGEAAADGFVEGFGGGVGNPDGG